jgi:phosphoglycerate dehydrogenase-like enzyme
LNARIAPTDKGQTMENPRVLSLVPFQQRHLNLLQQAAPKASFVQVPYPPTSEQRSLLTKADVVIGEPSPALLAEGTPVRWVQMTWAGTDLYTRGRVPFPEGMRLTNVAGAAYGHTISQYVVAQALSLMQNLPVYLRQQEQHIWSDVGRVKSFEKSCVLIFGTGDIGQTTAKRLAGFDCARIVGVCAHPERPRRGFDELVALPDAEAWLSRADVLVNCLPNTSETAGYLDERRLRMLREDSILINVGRGNFVDCDALAHVLAEGRLRGAALDVTNPEPLPKDHPLWDEPRCVITPHASGGAFGKSDFTEDRICAVCTENLRRFVAGEPLTHVVI